MSSNESGRTRLLTPSWTRFTVFHTSGSRSPAAFCHLSQMSLLSLEFSAPRSASQQSSLWFPSTISLEPNEGCLDTVALLCEIESASRELLVGSSGMNDIDVYIETGLTCADSPRHVSLRLRSTFWFAWLALPSPDQRLSDQVPERRAHCTRNELRTAHSCESGGLVPTRALLMELS